MSFPGISSVSTTLNCFPDQNALLARITTHRISPPDPTTLSNTGITSNGSTLPIQSDAQLPSASTEKKENVLTIQLIRGNSYDPTMTAHDNLVAELKANGGHLPSLKGQSSELKKFTFHCPAELENIPLFFPAELRMNDCIFSGKGTMHVARGDIRIYTKGINLFVSSNRSAGNVFVPGSKVTASNGAMAAACGGGEAVTLDNISSLKCLSGNFPGADQSLTSLKALQEGTMVIDTTHGSDFRYITTDDNYVCKGDQLIENGTYNFPEDQPKQTSQTPSVSPVIGVNPDNLIIHLRIRGGTGASRP